MYIYRNITEKLQRALKIYPVVLIGGARQVGKTTLVKNVLANQGYSYYTLDDRSTLLFAQRDPQGFIENLVGPVVIDEIQRVPELLLAIKHVSDHDPKAGRFVITGSANPMLLPSVADSLRGRIAILDVNPFSQGEFLGIKDDFLRYAFLENNFEQISKKINLETYRKDIVFRGGYPNQILANEDDRVDWFKNYTDIVLVKDLEDISNIQNIRDFQSLMSLLIARVGNLLNVSEVARDGRMSATTVHRYIGLLEALYLVNSQKNWSNNLSTRVIKSPKIYFNDTGLLTSLLDMSVEKIFMSNYWGAVLENFIFMELQKQLTWSLIDAKLLHFRTTSGIEVDIVAEKRDGTIVGIEIKAASSVLPNDLKGLKYLQEKVGDKFRRGIIFYTGKQFLSFGNNLYAVPLPALWAN
jgi:predicted AAA+ superfamily ATPase